MTEAPSKTPDRLEQYIRDENRIQPSVDDQVIVADWLYDHEQPEEAIPGHRTSDLEDRIGSRLDYAVSTVITNLETISVVAEVSRGGGKCIFHERTGEWFYSPDDEEFQPRFQEDLGRFLDDMHEQESSDAAAPPETLRTIASKMLEVAPPDVEQTLLNPPSLAEQISWFDAIVSAIKESSHVSREKDYDWVGWRNHAHKWAITQHAKGRKENASLDDYTSEE